MERRRELELPQLPAINWFRFRPRFFTSIQEIHHKRVKGVSIRRTFYPRHNSGDKRRKSFKNKPPNLRAQIENRQTEKAIVKQRQISTDSSEGKRISREMSFSPSYCAGQPEIVFKNQSQEISTNYATLSPAKIRPSPKRTFSSDSVRTSNSSNSISHHSASTFTDFAATPIPANPEYFNVPKCSENQKDKTPPPELPVDYEGSEKENAAPALAANTCQFQPGKTTLSRKDGNRQTITKETRTYMIDGVQVTSTTIHVLGVKITRFRGNILAESCEIYTYPFESFRKQQLHDLRRLQRDEARQKQKLQSEGIKLVDEQARKFTLKQTILIQTSELELDAMERRQRKEKRLRVQQEKDMRAFKKRLKQEMKIFKQELFMLSKVQRKDALKQRKDQNEIEHQLKEKQNAEAMLQRMAEMHKERMASIERKFLMQKDILLRAKENNILELEDKQMREKFVLHRKTFKDEYYLLRTQMLAHSQRKIAQNHQRQMAQIEKNH
ncbi:hypothetical protein CRE_07594 [Caenorhabditis remanei]|uniref:Uncharacterized protein n=1 Tax=Caenorhabditis remanei TaxID=31234 RepID=E3MP64_CAERE|nr:hypothetical protein CRE_07594 [Caenorhabditis remanei]